MISEVRSSPRVNLNAHVAYLRNSVRSVWTYRSNLAVDMASQAVQILVLISVWTNVYGSAESVQDIGQSDAVGYAVLASCLQAVLMPWSFSSLMDRVRGGQVGIDITRPLGLIPQCFMRNVGAMLARFPVALSGITTAALAGSLVLPSDGRLVGPFLISGLLGALLALILNLIVSFTIFWSLDISGYMMLYRLGSGLASGALIPLWFMPDWLASGLRWLPFQAQVFAPLSIYFDRVAWPEIFQIIVVQTAWLALAVLTLKVVWNRAIHKVVVLGG